MIKTFKKKIIHTSNNSNSDPASAANQNTKWEALQKLYDEELLKSNQLSNDRDVLESSLLNKEKLLVDQSKQLGVMQKMLNNYQKNVSTEHDLFEKEYNLWLTEKSKYENTINSLQSQLVDNSKTSNHNNDTNDELEASQQEDDQLEQDQSEIKNSFLGFMENLQNSLIHSKSSMTPNETSYDNSFVANTDDAKSEISFSNEQESDHHSVSSSFIDESLEIQNDQDIEKNNDVSIEPNNSVLIHDLKSDIKEASQKLAELNNVYAKMSSSHNAIISDANKSQTFNNSEISDDNNFDISVDDVDYDYHDDDENQHANAIINIDYQKLKTLEMELDEHLEMDDDDDQSVLALTHRLSKYRDSLALTATDNASILNKFGDLNSELNYSKELNFSLLLFVNQLVKDVEHLQKDNYKNNQILLDTKTDNSLAIVKKFDDGIVSHEINEHLQTVKNFLESHNYDNINKFPHPLRKKSSTLALTASEELDNEKKQEAENHKMKKSTSVKSLTDSHHNSFLPTRKLSKFFKKNTSVNSHIPVSKPSTNTSRADTSCASSTSFSAKTNSNTTRISEPYSSVIKNHDVSSNISQSEYQNSPSKSILSTSSKNGSSDDDSADMIEHIPSPIKKKLNDRRHSSHQPSIKRTLSNKVHERPGRQSIGNKISRVFSNNIHSNYSSEKYHNENDTTPFIINNETKMIGSNIEQKAGSTSNFDAGLPTHSKAGTDARKNTNGVVSSDPVHKAQSMETIDTFNTIPSVLAKNESMSEVRNSDANTESFKSLPKNKPNEFAHQEAENDKPARSLRKNKKAGIKTIEPDNDKMRDTCKEPSLEFHDDISDIIEEEDGEDIFVSLAEKPIIIHDDNADEDILAIAAARGSVVIADPTEYAEKDLSDFQLMNKSISATKINADLTENDSLSNVLDHDNEKENNIHSSSSEIHSKNSTIFSSNDDTEDAHRSLHDEVAVSQEAATTNKAKDHQDLQLDIEVLNHSESISTDLRSNEKFMNEGSIDSSSVIESICEMILRDKPDKIKEYSSINIEPASDSSEISYNFVGNILNSSNNHHIINNKSLIMSIHSFLENEKYDNEYLNKNPILKMLVSRYTNLKGDESSVNSTLENIDDLNVVD